MSNCSHVGHADRPSKLYSIYRLIEGKTYSNNPFTNMGQYDSERFTYSYFHCKGEFKSTLAQDAGHDHAEKTYYAVLIVCDSSPNTPTDRKPVVDPSMHEWVPLTTPEGSHEV